jgi:alpha/beta superfamily hydrolase
VDITQEIRFVERPGGGALYTALSLPVGIGPSRLAIICPPTFEEHGRSYAITRELARDLAAHGVATLRFDYVGVGESTAEEDDFTLSGAVADVVHLAASLRARFPSVPLSLVGLRFGGRVALDAVAKIRATGAKVGATILWDPLVDAHDYLMSELRSTIASAMVVYKTPVASREDIVKETLEKGSCVRGEFHLNQIDGFTVSARLLRDAGLDQATPAPCTFTEPVVVLVAAGAGDGERQKKALAGKLTAMEFHPVKEDSYWMPPPTYSQTRPQLFELTRKGLGA